MYKQKEKSLKKSKLLEELRDCSNNDGARADFFERGHKPKILVLDGKLSEAKLLCEKIEKIKAYKAFACQSEYSAFKLLKQTSFDLVVVNGELPNFDSFNFAKAVNILFGRNIAFAFRGDGADYQKKYFLEGIKNSYFFEKSENSDKFLDQILTLDLENDYKKAC